MTGYAHTYKRMPVDSATMPALRDVDKEQAALRARNEERLRVALAKGRRGLAQVVRPEDMDCVDHDD